MFTLKTLFTTVFTLFAMLLMPLFGNFYGAFSPKDPAGVLLNFAAISDTHIDGSFLWTMELEMALADMEDARAPLDALVLAGDITDHGEKEQWDVVAETFGAYTPAQNILLASGNHDTWTDEGGYAAARSNFLQYTQTIAGLELDEVYYSTNINGYPFILLGSESDSVAAHISDRQLAWFAAAMEEAAAAGKPIFVVCHQPLNGSHGLPGTWGDSNPSPETGGIGAASSAVEEIMKSYDNVFFISGHIHSGIGDKVTQALHDYKSVESDGTFHSINLPAFAYANPRGQLAGGNGFQFEVYEEQVVIRARSYTAGLWYTLYEYEIPLV